MKKKILSICLVVSLLAIAVVGGTLAYFTDTDAKTNTFTVGNVKIELHEYVSDANDDGILDSYPTEKVNMLPGVKLDKFARIENVGSNDAYVRVNYKVAAASKDVVLVDIPKNENPENDPYVVTVTDTADYRIYTVTFKDVLPADVVSEGATHNGVTLLINATVSLVNSFDWVLDESGDVAGYKYNGIEVKSTELNTDVIVTAEAIQALGFDNAADAFKAYDAQNAASTASEDTETVSEEETEILENEEETETVDE